MAKSKGDQIREVAEQELTPPVKEIGDILAREQAEAEIDEAAERVFRRQQVEMLAESIYVALIGNKGTTFSAYDIVNKAFHAADVFTEEAEKRRK